MRYSGVLALGAFATGVSAHTRMWGVWINGEDQGDGRGTYIRSPDSNSPVKDLTSADLACNTQGSTAVSEFLSMAAGDSLSFEWYHDSRNDDIIASSHKGPIITYIASYTDGMDGTGAIWSKIDEEGYDSSSQKWAVDNLISNSGKKDFTLPSALAAGKYMIRQEIIGLHEADTAYDQNSARGAQFYPSCIQVEVTGSGSATPDTAFALPGGYSDSDAGVVFNLYGSFTSYTIPGPELWSGASSSGSGSSSGSSSSAAAATTTKAATSAAATTSSSAAVVASTTKAAAATTTAGAATTLQTSVKATSAAAASKTSSAAQASASGKVCNKKKPRAARRSN
jgi:lytic cellulose monooxygenase (C1-hydroxylating)